MKRIYKFAPLLPIILSAPGMASAFCPICTVAVGAGLGLSRYLKIDDAISGIWVGALLMSASLWFAGYLKKRKWNTLWSVLLSIALYVATFVPLYYYGVIGHPNNQIFGIDKLIFGIIIGTIIFPISTSIHLRIKAGNKNKSHFPFQSVVIPISILLIASFALKIIISR